MQFNWYIVNLYVYWHILLYYLTSFHKRDKQGN